MHVIRIREAPARVHVGVPAHEREKLQIVLVSVELAWAQSPNFAAQDDFAQTTDYDQIIGFIREGMHGPAHLIETLADRLALFCLDLAPNAAYAEATIEKPSVLAGEGAVSVTIRRTRP